MQNERLTPQAQLNLDYLIELNKTEHSDSSVKSKASKPSASIKFKKEYKTCDSSKVVVLKQKLKVNKGTLFEKSVMRHFVKFLHSI